MTTDSESVSADLKMWHVPRYRIFWFLGFLCLWSIASLYLFAINSGQKSVAVGPLIKAWGSSLEAHQCTVIIDGSSLLPWRDKFSVGFACGIADATVDRLQDKTITISNLFSIQNGEIAMTANFRKAMVSKQEDLMARAHDSLPKSTPKGTPFTVPIAIWNEVVLLPKDTEVETIHRLSEVGKYGGAIMSQGVPPLP